MTQMHQALTARALVYSVRSSSAAYLPELRLESLKFLSLFYLLVSGMFLKRFDLFHHPFILYSLAVQINSRCFQRIPSLHAAQMFHLKHLEEES
jgi:hypothetical protein